MLKEEFLELDISERTVKRARREFGWVANIFQHAGEMLGVG